jgi:hypothetical protein
MAVNLSCEAGFQIRAGGFGISREKAPAQSLWKTA